MSTTEGVKSAAFVLSRDRGNEGTWFSKLVLEDLEFAGGAIHLCSHLFKCPKIFTP